MAGQIRVDPFVTSVTVIHMMSNGDAPNPSSLGSATGFIYNKEGSRYLITNRHVVIREERNHFPDELVIRVHTRPKPMVDSRDIRILLYSDENHVWLEHPSEQNIDVVAICIDDYITDTDVIREWSNEYFVQNDEIIDYGDSVLVMGYPRGFYDMRHNLHIGRSGTIASLYRMRFEGRRYFLVDAVLHPETSGSPVYIPRKSTKKTLQGYEIGSYPPVLLGINSGAYESLGLNTIWYADLIEDIIP